MLWNIALQAQRPVHQENWDGSIEKASKCGTVREWFQKVTNCEVIKGRL